MIARRKIVLAASALPAVALGATACSAAAPEGQRVAIIRDAIAAFNDRKAGREWDKVKFLTHKNDAKSRITLVDCREFENVAFAQISIEGVGTGGQRPLFAGKHYLMVRFGPANKVSSVDFLHG